MIDGAGDDGSDPAMADADWDEVYDRQAARGDLVPDVAEALDLTAGDAVIDLGSGPGYTAMSLADRVSPGPVYAVDRRIGALRFLVTRKAKATGTVHPVLSDVEALGLRPDEPTAVVLAFVLHHVDSPTVALIDVGRCLPAGSPLLVVEYDPGAPGDVGPPPDHRIGQATVVDWLGAAGFDVGWHRTWPEEKYAVLARRANAEECRESFKFRSPSPRGSRPARR